MQGVCSFESADVLVVIESARAGSENRLRLISVAAKYGGNRVLCVRLVLARPGRRLRARGEARRLVWNE